MHVEGLQREKADNKAPIQEFPVRKASRRDNWANSI